MNARSQLAMLRHNYNLHREQAKTKAGDMRWKVVFPKSKKQWVAKKIYEHSSNQYAFDLMAMTVDVQEELQAGMTPACQHTFKRVQKLLPKNIATMPNPGKGLVVATYQSRFM